MVELLIAIQAFSGIGIIIMIWQFFMLRARHNRDIQVLNKAVSVLQHRKRKPSEFTGKMCKLDRRLDALEHPGGGDMRPMQVPITRRN